MIQNGSKKPPFQLWSHRHRFKEIDDCKTRVVDNIEYELPFGLVGKLLESYIELKLLKIFKHREHATKQFLE